MSVGVPTGNIKAQYVFTVTVDHASCAANTSIETVVTVPGLKVGDFVAVNKPSLEAGLSVANARVSAADTLAIQVSNTTAGAIDEASETYTITVLRPESIVTGFYG